VLDLFQDITSIKDKDDYDKSGRSTRFVVNVFGLKLKEAPRSAKNGGARGFSNT